MGALASRRTNWYVCMNSYIINVCTYARIHNELLYMYIYIYVCMCVHSLYNHSCICSLPINHTHIEQLKQKLSLVDMGSGR